MRAMVYSAYGQPDVLRLEEVDKPIPKDDEVLIKPHAVSLNASDWEFLTGSPLYARIGGLFKPYNKILGSDIAGTIVATGKNVSRFRTGDAVVGDAIFKTGGLADYAAVPEKLLIKKPENIGFSEAAAIPQAGVVALQGLRDKGRVQAGDHVLINGAGGGAGTFAIQLAKMYGAAVTGVDSAEKQETMRGAGADHVLDYREDDFAAGGESYDLILDLVAYRSMFHHKRALKPCGRYVIVGGAVPRLLQTLMLGPFVKKLSGKEMGILAHQQNNIDLSYMLELYTAGKVKPVIDRQFTFAETRQAFQYLGDGHAKGKIIITIEHDAGEQP